MRSILIALFALLALACSDERSERCRDVCKQGDRCAEKTEDPNYKFDEGECSAACAFLEQDGKGAAIVASYIACVKKANGDCAAIRACD